LTLESPKDLDGTKLKWILVEDFIIILKKGFLHPGGNFLIERLSKKNVTLFFYG